MRYCTHAVILFHTYNVKCTVHNTTHYTDTNAWNARESLCHINILLFSQFFFVNFFFTFLLSVQWQNIYLYCAVCTNVHFHITMCTRTVWCMRCSAMKDEFVCLSTLHLRLVYFFIFFFQLHYKTPHFVVR